jgi:hypothetical protein
MSKAPPWAEMHVPQKHKRDDRARSTKRITRKVALEAFRAYSNFLSAGLELLKMEVSSMGLCSKLGDGGEKRLMWIAKCRASIDQIRPSRRLLWLQRGPRPSETGLNCCMVTWATGFGSTKSRPSRDLRLCRTLTISIDSLLRSGQVYLIIDIGAWGF